MIFVSPLLSDAQNTFDSHCIRRPSLVPTLSTGAMSQLGMTGRARPSQMVSLSDMVEVTEVVPRGALPF